MFAGGASLEVIETVCDAAVDIGLPVLDGLQELVDHSLLRQVRSPGPSPVRYAMLETIREYAAERLAAMPEADRVRGAHAGGFPGPGRDRRPPACGPGQEGMAGAGRRRAQQHPRGARLVPAA